MNKKKPMELIIVENTPKDEPFSFDDELQKLRQGVRNFYLADSLPARLLAFVRWEKILIETKVKWACFDTPLSSSQFRKYAEEFAEIWAWTRDAREEILNLLDNELRASQLSWQIEQKIFRLILDNPTATIKDAENVINTYRKERF